MRLLLISNSGRPPFAHCSGLIAEFLGPNAVIGFVTAASLGDEEEYVSAIRGRLVADGAVGSVVHIDWRDDWQEGLAKVDAVFVGGGNTYALLQRLTSSGLGRAISESVHDGLPYVGSSAGANVAGPNILTTNDWNVVGSTVFEALAFVPWNINPHYVAGAAEARTGETRDDRIRDYHLVRRNPVLAIEEGVLVEVAGGSAHVRGTGRVRVFTADRPDRWVQSGDTLAIDELGDEDYDAGATAGAPRLAR